MGHEGWNSFTIRRPRLDSGEVTKISLPQIYTDETQMLQGVSVKRLGV